MADLPPLHALTLATGARRPWERSRPCADESDLSEVQAHYLPRLRDQWRRVVAGFKLPSNALKYKDITNFPVFQVLQRYCKEQEFGVCASLVCPCGGVQRVQHFLLGEKYCKTCRRGEWNTKAIDAAKALIAEVKARNVKKFQSGAVEDEAMKWLKPILERWFPGIEVVVLPEFRHADFAVRFQHWPQNLHLPVQLKSNGPYREDGTSRPNDSRQDYRQDGQVKRAGGQARFPHVRGYEGLLMMFVKTRVEAGDVHRTLWWAWGEQVVSPSDDPTCSERPSEAIPQQRSGPLGTIEPNPEPLLSFDSAPMELYTMMRDADPARLHPLSEIWLDVRNKHQRKEMAGMLAMEQVGEVMYPAGYSTAIDCLFRGQPTQVKTYGVLLGSASIIRGSRSGNKRPYSSADGVQQLVELVIVKSGAAFYLLYAMQQLEALIEHGVFTHGDSSGQEEIRVPLGPYKKWLTGKPFKRTGSPWLLGPEHGFRPPVLLRETEPLSRALLEEVAYTATNPELLPASV